MKGSSLPIGHPLGVLNREQAAEYVNVSPSLFDGMVSNGRMPEAVELSERRFGWIQREIDVAIAALPRKGHAKHHAEVAEMSHAERVATEKFDAIRKAAKAAKLVSQY